MKKIILQTTAILLILAGVIACGKENTDENPYRKNIIGKWKLIKMISRDVNYDGIFDTVDYSNENIIYEFRANNKLIINGYIENDFSSGEHYYSYQQLNACPTCDPGPNLTIDDNNKIYCLTRKDSNEMSIGGDEVIINKKIKVVSRKFKQIK
ncbi:MAG: hypothetical protein LBP63_01665 [Prevotellaceae bacterium]|jgi:hypothetical protein|nr:hypothetical protein [Prevotellaceae bacterium]